MELIGPVSLAFILFNVSSCLGLLMQGLFVFNLSDGMPLASPLLFVVDLSLQLFLSMLQLVAASMFWKLRAVQSDAQVLEGTKRAGVVIALLQLVVFAMFGAASEVVVFRSGYQVVLTVFSVALVALLWSVWRTDILTDRGTMLQAALKFDLAALLLLGCYAILHIHQHLDAVASGSLVFARAVASSQWMLVVSGLCAASLLYIMGLWATCRPATARGRKNPVQAVSLRRLQLWNAACAAGGLLGAPIVVPCMVSCLLVGSTVEPELQTGETTPDIFFATRGDRFDLEY